MTLTIWTKAHSVLIQKKSNDNRYHRFHNINIYEANFNVILKTLISNRTMENAERIGLQEEKWGGRKQSSSADLGLDNLLTLEHVQLTKQPLGMADLDTTAC